MTSNNQQTIENYLAELRILRDQLATHADDTRHLTMRRRTTIARARTAGAMLEELSEASGISRQRIHTILTLTN